MKIEKWIKENCDSLEGKLVAITGSTGDIGKEICFILASLNAKLLFLNRSKSKTDNLKEELRNKFPNIEIDEIIFDLEKFSDVKEAVKVIDNYEIDYLILNAGAYKIKRKKTDLGYENVFQINFVSQYYIARKVLENMEKRQKGKVIAVSSIAHIFSKIDARDIDFSNKRRIKKLYGNSKRYLMYSLLELFKDVKNIELSIVHPGITYTNMTSHHNTIIYWIIKYPMKILFPKPKMATLSIIKGLFDSCSYNEWIGPRYLAVWGYPKKTKLKSYTKEESKKIDEIAQEIYSSVSKGE